MNALRTWNPFDELEALRREIDRAFEPLLHGGIRGPFSRFSFLPGRAARAYPLVNVTEDADNVYVEALAPGIDPETLGVSIVQDTLTISGEKLALRDVNPEAYHRNERSAGRFVRSFTLPAAVEQNDAKAEYRSGLLLITLPKAEQAKPRQIAVSVN